MTTAGGELAGRTALVTGASRGIGEAIARRFAQAGANVAVLGTSGEPRPNRLPGTVTAVAAGIREAGGNALALVADVRHDDQIESAVEFTMETFGGLDIVVNNAAAFDLSTTTSVTMKRFDLLHAVNSRGSFSLVRAALPYLEKSSAAHVLSISPPLTIEPRWLGAHLPYTLSKYAMSLATIGFAAEFADRGIAANALWPRTAVGTEAIRMILGEDVARSKSRSPLIMADAALAIVTRDPRAYTGNLLLDEDVLRGAGVDDLSGYLMPGMTSADAELESSYFLAQGS